MGVKHRLLICVVAILLNVGCTAQDTAVDNATNISTKYIIRRHIETKYVIRKYGENIHVDNYTIDSVGNIHIYAGSYWYYDFLVVPTVGRKDLILSVPYTIREEIKKLSEVKK